MAGGTSSAGAVPAAPTRLDRPSVPTGPGPRKASKKHEPVPENDSLGPDIDRLLHPDAPWSAGERLVGVKVRQACWFEDEQGRTIHSTEFRPGMTGRWITNPLSARELAEFCGGRKKKAQGGKNGRKGTCSKSTVNRALRVYQLAGVLTQAGGQRLGESRVCEKSRWVFSSRVAALWVGQDRGNHWDPKQNPEKRHYPPLCHDHEQRVELARVHAGLPSNDPRVAAASRQGRRIDRYDAGIARLEVVMSDRKATRGAMATELDRLCTAAGLDVPRDAPPTPASVVPPSSAAAGELLGVEDIAAVPAEPPDDAPPDETRERRRRRILDHAILDALSRLPPLSSLATPRNAELVGDTAVAIAEKRGQPFPDFAQLHGALDDCADKVSRGKWPAEIAVVRAFVKRKWPAVHTPLPPLPSPPRYVPRAEDEPTAEDIAAARAELAQLVEGAAQHADVAAAAGELGAPAPTPEEVDPVGARFRAAFDQAVAHVQVKHKSACDRWFGLVQYEGVADRVLYLTAAVPFARDFVVLNYEETLGRRLGELLGDGLGPVEVAWSVGQVVRPIVADAPPAPIPPRARASEP